MLGPTITHVVDAITTWASIAVLRPRGRRGSLPRTKCYFVPPRSSPQAQLACSCRTSRTATPQASSSIARALRSPPASWRSCAACLASCTSSAPTRTGSTEVRSEAAFDDPDALSLGFGQPCRREVGAWLRSFEARVEARFNALALTGWALASPVVAPHGCGRSLLSSVVDVVIPEPGDAGALDEDADLRERVVGYWSKMTGIDRQFAGVLGAPSTATKICALRTSPVVGSTMDTLCPAQSTNSFSPARCD